MAIGPSGHTAHLICKWRRRTEPILQIWKKRWLGFWVLIKLRSFLKEVKTLFKMQKLFEMKIAEWEWEMVTRFLIQIQEFKYFTGLWISGCFETCLRSACFPIASAKGRHGNFNSILEFSLATKGGGYFSIIWNACLYMKVKAGMAPIEISSHFNHISFWLSH